MKTTPSKLKFSLGDLMEAVQYGIRLGRSGAEQHTSCKFPATTQDVEKATETIMAKISTLTDQLNSIAAQAAKSKAEVIAAIAAAQAKIEELTAALADADLTPEQEAALQAVKDSVQAIDDLNPDAPAPTA